MRSALGLVSALLVLARSRIATALVWREPEPTPVELAYIEDFQGFTPRPTDPPEWSQGELELKLFKRDAYDHICGYESGVETWSYACSVGRTCYLFTQTSVWGLRGCCISTDYRDCGGVLSCVDYWEYQSAASCGVSCQADPLTLKCSDAASPYCQTFMFPGATVMDYNCGLDSGSTYRTILSTIVGQSAGPDLRTVALSDTVYGLVPASTESMPTSGSALSSSTSPPSPSPTIIQTEREKKKSTPIGAIVGGTVGGLAVLGLALGGILFYLYRSKRRQNPPVVANPAPGPAPAPGTGPYPGPGMVQASTGGYDAASHPVPPMAQSPPPPEYFAPVEKTDQHYHQQQQVQPPAQQPGNVHSWYGGTQSPPPQTLSADQQHLVAGVSPGSGDTTTLSPGSTLSGYNRPSYISSPSADSTELHGEAVTPYSPPHNTNGGVFSTPPPHNPDGGAIYEAPANPISR